MALMDHQREEASGLWAPPVVVAVSQLVTFAALLVVAWTNLAGENPTSWERFLGFAAALVSGLALGVGVCLYRQGRTVRHHMASQHPGAPVPTSPRA
jgi:ABC-type nitrate/sulfonate/bicarbonate transport system permease component